MERYYLSEDKKKRNNTIIVYPFFRSKDNKKDIILI